MHSTLRCLPATLRFTLPRQHRLFQVEPLVCIHDFKCLERIGLNTCTYRALHYCMKIDKDSCSQQLVNLAFARAVSAHQPLERGGFIRCEMVDVE